MTVWSLNYCRGCNCTCDPTPKFAKPQRPVFLGTNTGYHLKLSISKKRKNPQWMSAIFGSLLPRQHNMGDWGSLTQHRGRRPTRLYSRSYAHKPPDRRAACGFFQSTLPACLQPSPLVDSTTKLNDRGARVSEEQPGQVCQKGVERKSKYKPHRT